MNGERVPSTPAVLALPAIRINGGSRGFLVRIAPDVVVRPLSAQPVDVAIAP